MKKIALLSMLITFSYALFAQEQGIIFSHDSLLSDILKKSEKLKKPVFIDCYTKWCGPCKQLAKNVFPQKEVGEFYNSHFINVKFDMESTEGANIMEKYKIQAFPTLLFLDSDGEIIHAQLGAGDANSVIELGKTALDDSKNFRYFKTKLDQGDRTAEVITQYLQAYPGAENKDNLLNDYFTTLTADKKISEESWNLINRFVQDLDNPQFKFVLEHREEFEELVGKEDVENKILSGFGFYSYKHRDNPEKIDSLALVDAELYKTFKLRNDFFKAFSDCRRSNNPENMTIFISKAKEYLSKANIKPIALNDLCWQIYKMQKDSPNKDALELIKPYSESTCKSWPDNHFFNDTYAHILFDLGNIEDAIKYEEIAIDIAQKNKHEQLGFYTKELQRFKDSLKSN
ncbi:thioredoxin family protein [Plebeiibacterium marinum]|uniref:Thioredoxin domain-containing protein n=1 Tax=Plebeiibacterium marinum TaxID=2992111 RepID=A0AAE3SIY0_9BACT|nr:thioredoxin fold domain-containing protein [Plebeiobacterium marinum]MCW3805175.1 thioredoxin domain-containing protein [Plebeiobacterium marinum]